MAKDKNGADIKIGDTVILELQVTGIHEMLGVDSLPNGRHAVNLRGTFDGENCYAVTVDAGLVRKQTEEA